MLLFVIQASCGIAQAERVCLTFLFAEGHLLSGLQPPAWVLLQRRQGEQMCVDNWHGNACLGIGFVPPKPMQAFTCNIPSQERQLCRIMDTAREVLREALPIKCIEAVFLGALLTNEWDEADRLPVGFKSKCAGNTYRHIVLAVRHKPSGQWGALGIR